MKKDIVKNPSQIIIGETYRFYFKRKPKEEPYDYLDGIVDWVKKTKIRIAGVFKNNRFLKIIDFSSFKEIIRPEYDIVLPTEIISKTLIQNKERFDSKFFSIKGKIKISNASKILKKNRKVRYFFPEPSNQDYLYVDCIVKDILDAGYVFESLDTKDSRPFVMYINKKSEAVIQFLNKNVKIPLELKEPVQHLSTKDNEYFSHIKEKNIIPVLNNKKVKVVIPKLRGNKKQTKKAEDKKILSAISKKKRIKEGL